MPSSKERQAKNLATGLLFITPNIMGFLGFTVIPLLFSLYMAFSNWDLKLHNMFKPDESIRFIGLGNFLRLFAEENFWKYLGNTLFLMMGIPFSIAASLMAAMLLSKEMRVGGGRLYVGLITTVILLVSCALLVTIGAGGSAMMILLVGVVGLVMVIGVLGGQTGYRTLFYVPHFTSGVATFILWKKLYSPQDGPINTALAPMLDGLSATVRTLPTTPFTVVMYALLVGMVLVMGWGLWMLARMWRDGELGWRAAILPVLVLLLPVTLSLQWSYTKQHMVLVLILALTAVAWVGWMAATTPRDFSSKAGEGFGSAFMLTMALMVVQFILLGLAPVFGGLPEAAQKGIEAPGWHTNYHWAKPSIMLMGFWAAVGSNNMLLYLAALTNVPGELYEAADIDGASRFQKFWNVTWPQLAPTTFFIVVMSTIGGLQGGFEMARIMTQGGPAGATTTLSYFIYTEGFETGRLGYASAVAWTLFAMVFLVTMFNWRFGNRYVNE